MALPLREILDIEEKVDQASDHKFYENYKKKIVIRKARLIKDLSKKTNMIKEKVDFVFSLTTLQFKE